MKFVIFLALLIGSIFCKWPTAQATKTLSAPITVRAGSTYDGTKIYGKWVRFDRGRRNLGNCKNVEGGRKDAVFILEKGATLKNVILGANAVEHVHCVSDGCNVENVYWEDVCEDALTLENGMDRNARYNINGGGAKNGSDKIIQHNSAGTVTISNFYVENSGKLYRACGNCKKGYQGKRNAVIKHTTAKNILNLAGYNRNFGDGVLLQDVLVTNGKVCAAYEGNKTGKEPKHLGYTCQILGRKITSCTCK